MRREMKFSRKTTYQLGWDLRKTEEIVAYTSFWRKLWSCRFSGFTFRCVRRDTSTCPPRFYYTLRNYLKSSRNQPIFAIHRILGGRSENIPILGIHILTVLARLWTGLLQLQLHYYCVVELYQNKT